MDTIRNQILYIIDSKIQYTKTSTDIELDLRLNGKPKDIYGKYYYPENEILFTDNIDDLDDYQKRFTNEDIDDEKLKDDLLVERKSNGVDDTKLNPKTEHELKEPDPDEKIIIKKPKKHPL